MSKCVIGTKNACSLAGLHEQTKSVKKEKDATYTLHILWLLQPVQPQGSCYHIGHECVFNTTRHWNHDGDHSTVQHDTKLKRI